MLFGMNEESLRIFCSACRLNERSHKTLGQLNTLIASSPGMNIASGYLAIADLPWDPDLYRVRANMLGFLCLSAVNLCCLIFSFKEEKRLRASYNHSEESEREKFSLFSASVRESHEKERTRAERTKNWSIIGSVLGAIIGVLGSTYINRVRLQELKTLLLEAQKGPISLQEAIHEHASVHQSQQRDLGELILALRNVVPTLLPASQEMQTGGFAVPVNSIVSVEQALRAIKEHMTYTKETGKHVESLQQQYSNLEKSINNIATDVQNVKQKVSARTAELPITAYIPGDRGQEVPLQNVILELADTEQRLGTKINRNSMYSTALTCTVVALTLPVMYILLKGN